MRAPQEQLISALCHLFNAVPVWGLLFNGWIWFHLREESRTVRRTAQQAMTFHVLLMSGLLIWMLVASINRLLEALALGRLCGAIDYINDKIFAGLILVYIAICLFGALRVVSGKPFQYPMVRLRQ